MQVTKFEIDDVEVLTADYLLYPANDTRKYKIKLTGNYFTSGNQNITITAKWGYCAAVPADIKLAATVLVAGVISYTQKSTRSETIGNYTIAYENEKGWRDFDQVMKILDSYKKYTF